MGFSMELPDTEVIKKEIIEQIKPASEEVAKLREVANKNVEELLKIDMDSLEDRKSILKSIEDFGMISMEKSSKKNSLLQVSVGTLSNSGDEGGSVAKGLVELQREMKGLDPSIIDFTRTGLLGKLLNPLRSYFDRYQKADSVISDIVVSLDKGKTTLKNDNTTLEIEMLNATTNELITGTSRMLKEQGVEIHKQSMQANISVDTLKTAFMDCISAIDDISTYKQEALPKMRETIEQFKELAEQGEKQIQRLEKGSQLGIS